MPDPRWFAETLQAELLPAIQVVVGGETVEVTSLLRRETRTMESVPKTSSCWAPNKVAIDFDGEPTWEEYAIVQLLERRGLWACWIKFWYGTREICARPGVRTQVPADAQALLRTIERKPGSGGAWDVYAWSDGPLFIESKQYRSSDRLTKNQVAFLSAAIDAGVDPSCFAVVQYDAGKPLTSARG